MFRITAMIACLLIVGGAGSSLAAPVVIYDSGQTLPLPAPRRSIHATFAPPAGPSGMVNRFPVRTPAMQPGRVRARRIDRPGLTRPGCMAGVRTGKRFTVSAGDRKSVV